MLNRSFTAPPLVQATVQPVAVFWSAVCAALAVPMLLPSLLEYVTLGTDYGLERTGVVLAELAVVSVWLLGKREVVRPRLHPAIWTLLGIWLLASLVATIWAVHPVPAVLRSAEWVAHGLFAFVVWTELRRDPNGTKYIEQAVALGFAFFTALVVFEALKMEAPGKHNWMGQTPYLGNIRHFGIYALAGLAFAARPLLDAGASRVSKHGAVALMTLAWTVLWWSGGRASVGAAVVAGAVLFALAGPRRRSLALWFVVALGVGALLSEGLAVGRGGGGIAGGLGMDVNSAKGNGFTSGRTDVWMTALAAWQERPWLGVGPDGAAFLLSTYQQVQPHNLFVQVLVEWGIVGGIAFLGLLSWGLICAVRTAWAETDPAMRAARAVAVSYLLGATAHAMLDGLFYDARSLLFIAAASAVALVPTQGDPALRLMPTRARALVVGTVVTVALLFGLHLAVVRAVWTPETPQPDAARVQLLKAFPSPSHLRGTLWWAADWEATHPDEALDLVRWGGEHARLPWAFMRKEGDLLLGRGREAEALERYEAARQAEARAGRAD